MNIRTVSYTHLDVYKRQVYHRKLGITGINFWQEQGGSIGGITSDKAASVMLQETAKGCLLYTSRMPQNIRGKTSM